MADCAAGARAWAALAGHQAVGSLTLAGSARVGFPTLKRRALQAESPEMDENPEFLEALPTRRVATRYIVRIPVGLHVGGLVIDGTIVDISDSGVRVECNPPRLAPGTSVQMELRCFHFDERVSMLAKLVRDTSAGCSLRFADADPFLRVFVKVARLHDETVSDRLEKLLPEF